MNSDHVHTHPISDVLRVLAGQDDSPTHLDRIQMRLDESRRVDLESATVIIASWENRFAAAGGVRAVTREYAAHLTSANRKVRVLTPLHTGLGTPPGPIQLVSVLWHDFEGVRRRVEVLEANWAGVRWVYVHSEGFFCADGGRDRSNPYIYASDDTGPANTSPQLVRDCLFYATVAPKVLGALHLVDNLVIHLQDWETAGVALSVKSAVLRKDIAHAISILVLHNPYDKPLGSDGWAKLTDLPEPRDTPATFLGRMLPFVDAPPATVSREFAADLVGDPLQTACLADHLQRQFACCKPIGVDNGPFETVAPAFSVAAINDARNGMPSAILAEKQMHRNAMKRKMAEDQPAGRALRLAGARTGRR